MERVCINSSHPQAATNRFSKKKKKRKFLLTTIGEKTRPFTPLFRKFLFSNIRFTSKVTIVSYIGTYYAIGAAWILTVANYFAIGWFNGYLDKYYIDSWKVWFSIVIVFNGLGNVSLATMRYRIGERGWFSSLFENLKWT